MLMNDSQIKVAIESAEIGIDPFSPENLQGASYDLAIGGEALVTSKDEKILLGPKSSAMLHLNPGDFALVLTKEYITMPLDVAGVIGMRSALARKGLILLAGMQIDPGFEGHLRFGLYNASPRRITLDYDDGLCMVEFHKLSSPVDRPQTPIPELRQGKIPESDRDFLRSLETSSLSDLATNMKTLSQSVALLTNRVNLIVVLFVPVIIGILCVIVAHIVKISK
ncbi:MAG: dCTP deaminase [Phycisphaerae bacterium]|nr:dCTP deaminase [Phycisphaerae bacterium]